MYWCKRNIVFLIGFGLIPACKPEIKQGGPPYFDVKGYFTNEAAKLTRLNKPVLKTVDYNALPEQKQVMIKNWPRELALFTESDINKPAWRGSYKTISNKDSLVLIATDTALRTRRITIAFSGNKVKAIHIVNFTKNMLYQSTEYLSYYPDSVYVIEKRQSVKVMGANNFRVSGRLK